MHLTYKMNCYKRTMIHISMHSNIEDIVLQKNCTAYCYFNTFITNSKKQKTIYASQGYNHLNNLSQFFLYSLQQYLIVKRQNNSHRALPFKARHATYCTDCYQGPFTSSKEAQARGACWANALSLHAGSPSCMKLRKRREEHSHHQLCLPLDNCNCIGLDELFYIGLC